LNNDIIIKTFTTKRCTCGLLVSLEDCHGLGLSFDFQDLLKKRRNELSHLLNKVKEERKTLELDAKQEARWYIRRELIILAFDNYGNGSTVRRPCPDCNIIIRKTGGCNAMKCPVCQCEFDWLSGDTKDENLGYLSLFYHMDTTSKYKNYWSSWPQMTMNWVLTGELPQKKH